MTRWLALLADRTDDLATTIHAVEATVDDLAATVDELDTTTTKQHRQVLHDGALTNPGIAPA